MDDAFPSAIGSNPTRLARSRGATWAGEFQTIILPFCQENPLRPMKWISATQLEQWARSHSSQVDLPGLVADLIRASSGDIAAMRFPSGDKGRVRGFDGHLISNISALNVPEGRSYWELGTDADYKGKAKSDFEKRSAEIDEAQQRETTFVFVSPWTWDSSRKDGKLEEWVEQRKAEAKWREVFYIDGSQLETWLEACPAVAAWHARNTVRCAPLDGVRSTDEFWQEFADRFSPRITEEVLLCEREIAQKDLIDTLVRGPGSISFSADSPDEVIAFGIAAIRQAIPEVRLFLESRTIVIDNMAVGRQLLGEENLVFFLRGDAAKAPGQFAEKGAVLVPLGRQQRSGSAKPLPRPSGHAMGMAMTTMGLPEGRALTLARGCGRSLPALARQIPGGFSDPPPWLTSAPKLLPAILSGAWDSASELDCQTVQNLAGLDDYHEYERELRPFLIEADPPLDLEGTVWKVRAPVDAFVHAGHLIGNSELQRLAAACGLVFSQIVDRPNEEETLLERAATHSSWLRDGLATTLLQFSVLSQQAGVSVNAVNPQVWVEQQIRLLPGLRESGRLLASLRHELPILMEAAPNPLLAALEHLLEGQNNVADDLFWAEEPMFGPTSPHVYVLWALERLAWDPQRLPRVTLILGKLAEIDQLTKESGNRPINSLRSILLPWQPNTHANLDGRLAALDLLIERNPNIGWKLALELLPRSNDTSISTERPRFRDAGASESEVLTRGLVASGFRGVVDRVLTLAANDRDRLLQIIPEIGNWDPERVSKALNLLEEFLRSSGEGRYEVWSGLRDLANRHRAFADADWALSEDNIAKIETLVQAHQPQDSVRRLIWLFNDWLPDLPGSFEHQREEITRARAAALKEVSAQQGVEGVFRLVSEAMLIGAVAEAVSDALTASPDEFERYVARAHAEANPHDLEFAAHLSAIAYRRFPLAWCQKIRSFQSDLKWSTRVLAILTRTWPDNKNTWDFLHSLGNDVEEEYWRTKQPFGFQGSTDEALEGIAKYLRCGRPTAALVSSHRSRRAIPSDVLLEILNALPTEIEANQKPIDNMIVYMVEEVFKEIDLRDDIKTETTALLEYTYLPLLRRRDRKLAIHAFMAASPEFYASLIRSVFRSNLELDRREKDKGSRLDPENIEEERRQARWRLDYDLLQSFRTLPGHDRSGVSGEILHSWILKVRELGAESGRSEISDQYIGHVLAYSPEEEDGWPHQAVSQLLEELRAPEIERGIMIECFNKRGVYSKALFEGGSQERELAEKYRRWARLSANRFPRTAAMLEEIAKGWDREGEREDVRARQDKLRS